MLPDVRHRRLPAAGGSARRGDYERIHKEVLSRMPGVARIQSSFAIRAVIRGA